MQTNLKLSDERLRDFVALVKSIPGLKEYVNSFGYGGDPYLHMHYDAKVGVCAYNVSVSQDTPEHLVAQVPLEFEGEPVMVHLCEVIDTDRGKANREAKRRLHTGEIIDSKVLRDYFDDWLRP